MFIATVILGLIFLLGIMTKDKWMPSEDIPIDAYLIDVRTPQEYSNGSVANARNIPLSQISSYINELSDKDNIVVFCRSGMRSGKAKNILQSNGIKKVVNGGSFNRVQNAISKQSNR